jgi:hypothetical protein
MVKHARRTPTVPVRLLERALREYGAVDITMDEVRAIFRRLRRSCQTCWDTGRVKSDADMGELVPCPTCEGKARWRLKAKEDEK